MHKCEAPSVCACCAHAECVPAQREAKAFDSVSLLTEVMLQWWLCILVWCQSNVESHCVTGQATLIKPHVAFFFSLTCEKINLSESKSMILFLACVFVFLLWSWTRSRSLGYRGNSSESEWFVALCSSFCCTLGTFACCIISCVGKTWNWQHSPWVYITWNYICPQWVRKDVVIAALLPTEALSSSFSCVSSPALSNHSIICLQI